MICAELTTPAIYPMLTLLSQPIYLAGRENVTDISVTGEHLLMEGPYIHIETKPIIECAEA